MTNRILTKNLYQALKQVKRTTPHALPVLNHIRMEFTNGELRLTSTDLDNTLKATCACQTNDEWSTCVPMINVVKIEQGMNKGKHKYYPFIDYIKVMSEQYDVIDVDFKPDVQVLVITGGRSRTEFKCLV